MQLSNACSVEDLKETCLKTKKKCNKQKIQCYEVEYGIHFDGETEFFKHIQLYFTPKKIFLNPVSFVI